MMGLRWCLSAPEICLETYLSSSEVTAASGLLLLSAFTHSLSFKKKHSFLTLFLTHTLQFWFMCERAAAVTQYEEAFDLRLVNGKVHQSVKQQALQESASG